MKYTIHAAYLVAIIVSLWPAASRAQFRDLSKRPNTDTAAISRFISSYRGRDEALFAKTTDKQYFGPLLSFANRQFVSEQNSTLPLESASDLVTIGTSSFFAAVIGGGAGSIVSLATYFSAASKDVTSLEPQKPTGSQIALMVASPIAGAVIGGIIGHFIPREENAAPMNAFRTR